jgi:hypothetical protein
MSDEPERIQLRRTKGWRKPEGAVVVARPSRWGNPFRTGEPYHFTRRDGRVEMGVADGRESVVRLFEAYLEGRPDLRTQAREELAGRVLACWCPLDQPCHADVLIRVANRAPDEDGGTDR